MRPSEQCHCRIEDGRSRLPKAPSALPVVIVILAWTALAMAVGFVGAWAVFLWKGWA